VAIFNLGKQNSIKMDSINDLCDVIKFFRDQLLKNHPRHDFWVTRINSNFFGWKTLVLIILVILVLKYQMALIALGRWPKLLHENISQKILIKKKVV